MPANINFTTFTDPNILFVSKDAVNTFFGSITVSDATATVPGVVKKAAVVNVDPLVTTPTYDNLTVQNEDGTSTIYQVPDKNSFDALVNNFKTLIANLQSAGTLT